MYVCVYPDPYIFAAAFYSFYPSLLSTQTFFLIRAGMDLESVQGTPAHEVGIRPELCTIIKTFNYISIKKCTYPAEEHYI